MYDHFKTPRDRYLNDPQFKVLVDMMTACVLRCEYTPSEMREAAVLSSILYREMQPPRPFFLSEAEAAALSVTDKWASKTDEERKLEMNREIEG